MSASGLGRGTDDLERKRWSELGQYQWRAAADGPPGGTEQGEDGADDGEDDAEGDEDADVGQEADETRMSPSTIMGGSLPGRVRCQSPAARAAPRSGPRLRRIAHRRR